MAKFTGMLAPLNSADYLRVRPQTPSGALEPALHKTGQSHSGLILALLSASVNHPDDDLSNSLLFQAITGWTAWTCLMPDSSAGGCCPISPRRIRDGPTSQKPSRLGYFGLPYHSLDPQVQIDRRPDTACESENVQLDSWAWLRLQRRLCRHFASRGAGVTSATRFEQSVRRHHPMRRNRRMSSLVIRLPRLVQTCVRLGPAVRASVRRFGRVG